MVAVVGLCGAPYRDQLGWVLAEFYRRFLDRFRFVGGPNLAQSYGTWRCRVDFPTIEQ